MGSRTQTGGEAEAKALASLASLDRVPREVYDLLAASKTPLKPYDLLWRLQNARGRAAPPSTIYRALAVLVDAGLVHRIGTIGAYTLCQHLAADHEPAFLICDVCGAASELDASSAHKHLEQRLTAQHFLVHSFSFVFRGICASCQTPER